MTRTSELMRAAIDITIHYVQRDKLFRDISAWTNPGVLAEIPFRKSLALNVSRGTAAGNQQLQIWGFMHQDPEHEFLSVAAQT